MHYQHIVKGIYYILLCWLLCDMLNWLLQHAQLSINIQGPVHYSFQLSHEFELPEWERMTLFHNDHCLSSGYDCVLYIQWREKYDHLVFRI